jgi:hypothetical protein
MAQEFNSVFAEATLSSINSEARLGEFTEYGIKVP